MLYGRPSFLLTDNGPQFRSTFFRRSTFSVAKKLTKTGYNLQQMGRLNIVSDNWSQDCIVAYQNTRLGNVCPSTYKYLAC